MANVPGQEIGLIVVGANHQTSTMLFRDKIAIRHNQLALFLDRLKEVGISQSLVTSNSDRTEFYVSPTPRTDVIAEIIKLLSAHSGVSRTAVEAQIYRLTGHDAVRHLVAVCCRLDGLVIGDPRPVNGLKDGLAVARKKNLANGVIQIATAGAFNAAARVQRETEIGLRPVSIPAAAVQVSRDLHGDLGTCTGLLVGAGEMGELLANSFVSAGLKTLLVTHHMPAKAEALGQQLNCHVGDIDTLPDLLAKSDIVLTSMNSRRFTLTIESVRRALKQRRRKPMFIIDTGVPGDVEQNVESLEDAYLYNLDDLERVTREGWDSRETEAEKAWAIVDEETEKIMVELSSTPLKPSTEAHPSDDLEILRQEVLKESGGNADQATRMILDRIKEGEIKEFNRTILPAIEDDK